MGSGAFFLRSLAREAAAELQQGDELLRGEAADAAARVRIALQVRHAEHPEERSGRDLRPEQRAALGQALGQLPQGGKVQRAARELRRGHAAAQAEALRHLIERAVPAQGVEIWRHQGVKAAQGGVALYVRREVAQQALVRQAVGRQAVRAEDVGQFPGCQLCKESLLALPGVVAQLDNASPVPAVEVQDRAAYAVIYVEARERQARLYRGLGGRGLFEAHEPGAVALPGEAEDVPALLLEDGGKHVAVKARVGEIQQLLRLLFPRREAQQALPV